MYMKIVCVSIFYLIMFDYLLTKKTQQKVLSCSYSFLDKLSVVPQVLHVNCCILT